MKEKLIELLKQGEDATPCSFDEEVECDGIKCSDCERESMADYLIANGVTVQKRGEWEWKQFGKNFTAEVKAVCSLCGQPNKQYTPPYCPHCGAKMDAPKDGE